MNQQAWEPTIHKQGIGNSRNLERRTMRGSGWETFNLERKNKLTWEK